MELAINSSTGPSAFPLREEAGLIGSAYMETPEEISQLKKFWSLECIAVK